MSLEALVIVATAVGAHGPSFENRLPQHTKTAHVKREPSLKHKTFEY